MTRGSRTRRPLNTFHAVLVVATSLIPSAAWSQSAPALPRVVIGLSLAVMAQASSPSVRSVEPEIQALIEKGIARSETFRSLIAKLAGSDVIVYIESKIIRQGLVGSTSHRVIVRGGYRYVRLAIDPHGPDARLIAVIAHELQHAIEIAQAPEVGRSETAEGLFRRIGFRFGCPQATCYETKDATIVERLVRDELGTGLPSPGLPVEENRNKSGGLTTLSTRNRWPSCEMTCAYPYPRANNTTGFRLDRRTVQSQRASSAHPTSCSGARARFGSSPTRPTRCRHRS